MQFDPLADAIPTVEQQLRTQRDADRRAFRLGASVVLALAVFAGGAWILLP